MSAKRRAVSPSQPAAGTAVKRGFKAMLDGVLHQRDQQYGGRHLPRRRAHRADQAKRQAISIRVFMMARNALPPFQISAQRGGLAAQPGQARPQKVISPVSAAASGALPSARSCTLPSAEQKSGAPPAPASGSVRGRPAAAGANRPRLPLQRRVSACSKRRRLHHHENQ